MATADKRTLLRDAVRFVQKGQIERAIDAYRAIAKADPKDSKVRNELGDLYIKQGKKKEAIAEYLETANLYEKDGFALRAIALCQKILNLDAELAPVRLRLADLYAGQRLAAEARAQYLQVANYYDKKGSVAEALDVFRRIADLEPDNVPVRVKLAGMFEKQKFPEKASSEYARAARGALAKGDPTTAVKLFVRAFKLHPANPDARRGLADFHRERKDWPVLVGLLQPLVTRGSRDTELLVLYGEALTHVGHAAEAAKVLEKVREREPNSVAVNLALGRALMTAGDAEGGLAAHHRAVGAHIAENRLEEAEALLREMSDGAPGDDLVPQRLLEIAQKRGDADGVAAAYLRLAAVHEAKGLVRAAAGALEKYLESRPDDADATARLAALREQAPLPVAPPAVAAAGASPPTAGEPGIADVDVLEVGADADAEVDVDLDVDVDVDVDVELGDGGDAGVAPSEGEGDGEEFDLVVEGEEAAAPTPPVEPSTLAEAAEATRSGAPGRAAAFLEERLADNPDDIEAARLLADARRAQGGGAALRDALLRLAGVCRRAGLLEEARFACQDALAADPRSSAAALTLAQIVLEEERMQPAAAPVPAPPSAPVPPPEAAPGAEEEEIILEAPADAEPPLGVGEDDEIEIALPEGFEEAPPAAEQPLVTLPEPEEVPEPAVEGAGPAATPPVAVAPSGEVEAVEAAAAAGAAASGLEPGAEDLPGPVAPAEASPAEVPGEPTAVEPPGAPPPPVEEDAAAPEFWSDILDAGDEVAAAAPSAGPGEAQGASAAGIGDDLDAFDLLDEAAPPPPPAPPVPPAPPPAAVPAPPGAAEGGAEIDEFLAEADFYFQQGLLDEAEFLYRKLLKLAPGRPEIGEQLRRLEAVRGEAPSPAEEAGGEVAAVGVVPGAAQEDATDFSAFLDDLRQEIETELPPAAEEPAQAEGGEEGLTEIFQEFQRNVREQLGEEDFETHYNLGIAYKEMGLMQEALAEFALAERSPSRRADALSMVALCLREMGRFDDAVAKLEAGVAEVPEGGEQQKGFLYDLAGVQEQAGRPAEAQAALRRLLAIDPGYRDAASRVLPDAPAKTPRKTPRVGYL